MPSGTYSRNPNKIYGSTGKHWKMPEGAKERISKLLTGHPVSEETRRKIGIKHKGIPTWNKGQHLSEEWKKKLSEAQKGEKSYWFNRPKSEETRARISKTMEGRLCKHWVGKHHSSEARSKISLANKGENHYNWMGGKSLEPYPIEWGELLRRDVRERDRCICKICGSVQGDTAHDVHHIDYNKKNSSADNLVALCHSCHSKTNRNRDFWEDFFRKEIEPKWHTT